MRKRMRKAFITVILLIGMFVGYVTPVFAGQVGQSFRFTLKNRTSLSVTVEVTFEIFQDYVTTTPYNTTKKTYTVAPNGQTDCWSMGSLYQSIPTSDGMIPSTWTCRASISLSEM